MNKTSIESIKNEYLQKIEEKVFLFEDAPRLLLPIRVNPDSS